MRQIKMDTEYSANNPEPQEFKDSARVRSGEQADALHASLEYINGAQSSEQNKLE